MKKKDLPFDLYSSIKSIIDKNGAIIYPVAPEGNILHLKDKDPNSDYYFKITSLDQSVKPIKYNVEFLPQSKNEILVFKYGFSIPQLSQQLEKWVQTIIDFNSLNTIFDNPYVHFYESEMESKIDISLFSDSVPFSIAEANVIDLYLESTNAKYIEYRGKCNDSEIRQLKFLQDEVDELKKNISKLSQRGVVLKLRNIWAKTYSFRVELFRDILVNLSSDLFRQVLSGIGNSLLGN